ncbi:MAG: [protein-PII] uridylyltransferase, partial [Pseudonocardia sp.]|nr:[protein-PII] uridylyltransferase [Pseudonocardia sp.]
MDLIAAKAALLEPGGGKRRLGPEALRAALVDLHDFWLSARAAAIGLPERAALVAVGALGRRELAPWSDLDLVLLHDGHADVDRLADGLWYPLWDAGIGLDHSVRTPGQAVAVAAGDLRAAFGLLEARHIVGDAGLTATMQDGVRQAWRAGIRTRFDEIADSARERWAKVGDVAHRVEPDLKSGHGGLRDVQLLDALAAAQLLVRPGGDVSEARTMLLDVRTELHRLAGRARDVLRAQDADEVAAALAVADRFELARALSGAARSVAFATEVGLRSARSALPRRGLAALRRAPVRRPLDTGVVEHGGEVTLARDASASRDPALMLRVAATAARTGYPIAAGTLNRLAETAPELHEPWPRAALDELLALLGAGTSMVDVVEALDRTGLWGRLFPEWGAVRDLPPRDRAHVWTVDRHLVETAARAARLTTRVTRPDLLLVGALLHDIGKGRGGDHSVVGAALAAQVGSRLGFAEPDVAALAALVRHHLLLPHTATRRDLDDPATVTRVVETLTADAGEQAGLVLGLLEALAEADSHATGPGVWSPWKQSLIGGLVDRCRTLMAGDPLPAPGLATAAEVELAAAVVAEGRAQLVVADAGGSDGPATVVLAMPDRVGSLAAAAGVLALHSLEVHAAELRTIRSGTAHVAVFTFTTSPRFGRLPDPALMR